MIVLRKTTSKGFAKLTIMGYLVGFCVVQVKMNHPSRVFANDTQRLGLPVRKSSAEPSIGNPHVPKNTLPPARLCYHEDDCSSCRP
jgi:hypothetical protein